MSKIQEARLRNVFRSAYALLLAANVFLGYDALTTTPGPPYLPYVMALCAGNCAMFAYSLVRGFIVSRKV